jgi:hypothetical protein
MSNALNLTPFQMSHHSVDMARSIFLLAAALCALLAAGCGGSGGGVDSGRSRESLSQWLKSAFSAHSANANMEALSGLGRGSRGGADGTEPGGDGSGPYYDEWLGLWAVSTWDTTSFTTSYFLDEALTLPAGSSISSWTNTETESTGTSQVDITAGPSTGYKLRSEYTFSNSTFSGSYSSLVDHPIFGHSEDSGVWNADGSGSYDSLWSKGADFFEHHGVWNADGSWSNSSSGSDGYGMTLNGRADGSGTGSLTGPDPLLPAIIAWNTLGQGLITWADGSTTEFSWFGIAGDPGGATGGGDGSGGGSSDGSGGTGGSPGL